MAGSRRGAAETGLALRELDALTRRYSVLTRAVVACGCVLFGLVVVPGVHPALAAAGMLLLLGWIIAYTVSLLRSPTGWLVVGDVALVGLAALAQRWTVPGPALVDASGWALAAVTITALALQWHTGAWWGTLAALLLVAAQVAGGWIAEGAAEWDRLGPALFVLPYAAVSRVCASALRNAARRSDELLAERERSRTATAVGNARRADERAHQALLHDTVAATLLMVGLGTVPGPRAWLAEQAGRDLLVLDGRPASGVPTDLADLLGEEVWRSPVPVRYDPPLPHLALPGDVAQAVAGSVRESLRNVARHAAVDHATLTVTTDPLCVEVADAGRGFEPDLVPGHRRGLSRSIVARMAAVGGHAAVTSAPGRGTRVHLEWPHA